MAKFSERVSRRFELSKTSFLSYPPLLQVPWFGRINDGIATVLYPFEWPVERHA